MHERIQKTCFTRCAATFSSEIGKEEKRLRDIRSWIVFERKTPLHLRNDNKLIFFFFFLIQIIFVSGPYPEAWKVHCTPEMNQGFQTVCPTPTTALPTVVRMPA